MEIADDGCDSCKNDPETDGKECQASLCSVKSVVAISIPIFGLNRAAQNSPIHPPKYNRESCEK